MPSTALILAVLNEEKNVGVLIDKINELKETGKLDSLIEIIFVDGGSTDSTKDVIMRIKSQSKNYKVRLIEQMVRPGTAPATLEAVRSTKCDYIIVMDADLQHPPETLPLLIKKISEGFDIVVASRDTNGGQVKRTLSRMLISKGAKMLAWIMVTQSKKITDPVSGYFIAKRSLLTGIKPKPALYKILLYIIATHNNLSVTEIPYCFGDRLYGASKITKRSTHIFKRYIAELLLYNKLQHLNKSDSD
jgi:dolichol-phosphate mannosyltransferase